jgi:NAD-dependent dihydropyrimidine dehydrogenase PreA subunit
MGTEAKDQALAEAISSVFGDPSLSRRRFLLIGGISVIGMSAVAHGLAAAEPVLYAEQANGLVIGDPTKCVGCRRCELACTEFNDGKAAPSGCE